MNDCADDGNLVEMWHDLMSSLGTSYQIALSHLAITHFAKSTNLTHACSLITQLARSTNFIPDYIFFTISLSL